ncbi:MAG: uL15 family ribosomal protein [Candidatus Aenigmarchaeota archaeon]|nr:uL15 family ribosomal protein [Candidatus Aenigmarchaeota archaeon]
MASKRVNRFRGSRTHGCGSHKKRRGAGSRGGRGMTGAKAHRFVKFLKEKPGHIGKYGFTSHVSQNLKTINLCELERLADRLGIKEVKLKEMGYDKLLGKGKLSRPFTVHVDFISSKAREKVETAGGKAIVPEPEPEKTKPAEEEAQTDE